MSKETIRKFKWFWAWQDEQEESWLGEMSRQGLHLDRVTLPAVYHFNKGDPAQYVYRLDFQSLKSRDRDSYLQLFKDAGWEHIGDMGGWLYFRHRVNGDRIPEIYSDPESKIGKYQRVLLYMTAFLPIMIINMSGITNLERYGTFGAILQFLSFLILILFAAGSVQIFRRINQLKKRR